MFNSVRLIGLEDLIRNKFSDLNYPTFYIFFRLLPHIKGNVGFVFTKEDLNEVRNVIRENKVEAPAKAGAIAPIDVKVSPINTGLGPEKTSFFQALAIPTKITRGTIEILVWQGLYLQPFFLVP